MAREHFLAKLVTENHLTKGAELGVWRGRTFLHLLKYCPGLTLIGVDAWRRRPENEGIPGAETYNDWPVEDNENYVRSASSVYGERAILYKMDTHEASRLVSDGSLDFVFIDAGHDSESVKQDILDWTPKVKQGGFIVGHDWDWPTVRVVAEAFFKDITPEEDNVWYSRLPV